MENEPFVKPYIDAILKAVKEAEDQHVVRTSVEKEAVTHLKSGKQIFPTIKLTIEYSNLDSSQG